MNCPFKDVYTLLCDNISDTFHDIRSVNKSIEICSRHYLCLSVTLLAIALVRGGSSFVECRPAGTAVSQGSLYLYQPSLSLSRFLLSVTHPSKANNGSFLLPLSPAVRGQRVRPALSMLRYASIDFHFALALNASRREAKGRAGG